MHSCYKPVAKFLQGKPVICNHKMTYSLSSLLTTDGTEDPNRGTNSAASGLSLLDY